VPALAFLPWDSLRTAVQGPREFTSDRGDAYVVRRVVVLRAVLVERNLSRCERTAKDLLSDCAMLVSAVPFDVSAATA
jgi:hypothetical protein